MFISKLCNLTGNANPKPIAGKKLGRIIRVNPTKIEKKYDKKNAILRSTLIFHKNQIEGRTMTNSVISVIGKDRVGIVYDVAKILAEHQINIVNISQQLMDDYFTMIILVDTAKCPKSFPELAALFELESKNLALDIRLQNEEIFKAMHRI